MKHIIYMIVSFILIIGCSNTNDIYIDNTDNNVIKPKPKDIQQTTAKQPTIQTQETTKIVEIPNGAFGICQVCKDRLVSKRDNDIPMCDICIERRKGRVDNWLLNQSGETIWIDELADSNNRVALIGLKFELDEWLNGDFISSLMVRNEDFISEKNNIKDILIKMKNFYRNQSFNFNNVSNSNNQQFFKLFDNLYFK